VSAADRVEAAGTSIPALAIGGVEVVSGPVVRGAAAFGLRLGRFAAQLAVLLAWALSLLSRFPATLGARDALAGALSGPLLGLGARLAGGVPLLAGLALVAVLVGLLARAAGVYFEAVARGDAGQRWFTRELAPTLGRLAQAGIVLAALLMVAAAVGGDGLLGGLARAVVLGLGLAAAPLAGSALAGLPLLLGRVLRPGDVAELGGHRGRVVEVNALAVVLEDERGGLVRVPHLLSLFRPTRVERRDPGAPR
jgi:small-conductance mechanosensitive channel